MKKTLRQTAFAFRQQLSEADITACSRQMAAHLVTLLQTFPGCTVGLFYPSRGEPALLDLLTGGGLTCVEWALPVCCDTPSGSILKFAAFRSGDELEAGRYDIPVPLNKEWVQPGVMVIPCLAYHPDGSRLGYGAGWYDRTLAAVEQKPICIGVAYSATCSSEPFAEPHDQLLDFITTENGVVNCKAN